MKPLVDRRRKVRICELFPTKIKGADPQGNLYEIDTVLENLSASGLYVRMAQKVQEGDKLSIRIKLPPVSEVGAPGLNVLTEGDVLRVDCLESDSFGVAVVFTRSVRFTRYRVV